MNENLPDDLGPLRQYFTPRELAVLSPEELWLLALLQHEEVPEVPVDEVQAAEDDYRQRVIKKLQEQGLTSSPSTDEPPPGDSTLLAALLKPHATIKE